MTSSDCIFNDNAVTPKDIEEHQGHFAELLAYYSSIFKILCVILFTIILTEYILIYMGKLGKLKPRTVNKVILFRRIVCLILAKVGIVVISYMSANTESSKFNYIKDPESNCTKNGYLLAELGEIAEVLPKVKSSMMIYIIFIATIILLNGAILAKKCY